MPRIRRIEPIHPVFPVTGFGHPHPGPRKEPEKKPQGNFLDILRAELAKKKKPA